MEASEAASARAAPATNESNKWSAALSRGGAVAMCAMLLLFAWLAAGTLRRCHGMDEEEVISCVMWGLSPLIWAYLYSWTAVLSPAPRANDAGGGGIVARTATLCLLLVAAAADKLAPADGAAAIVIAQLCAACACWRALAERRQCAGTERWSAAAVASTPTYQSRAEERDRKANAAFVVQGMAVVLSASVWFITWAEAVREWKAPTTNDVRLFQPCLLGSPVLAKIDDMRTLAAVIGVVGWLVAAASAGALFGTIAGTLVVWVGELGMVGFLGYFLAVEAHYEQLMAIERRKPRRAKDASGLLDGRDSDDASSAHIDAAAGVCSDCVLPGRCKCHVEPKS